MESDKQKYPSFIQNAKYYFWEFCDRTSTHGFNFLGEQRRTIWERVWWVIIILVAIYFSIAMVCQTYGKWKSSPVIVTFATEHTPIQEIPFPAVTICPEMKSVKERYNYTHYYLKKIALEDLTPDETAKFEYMSLVCNPEESLLDENFTTVGVAALDFLYEVQPKFADSVITATWGGKEHYDERVSEIFSPIITSQGICYTFNMIDRSELFMNNVFHFKDTFSSNGKKSSWSLDNGYAEDSDINSYPRRTLSAGTRYGLQIVLNIPKQDIDHTCGDAFQGFRVALHSPDQIPRIKQQYFRLPLDQSLVVSIKPKRMTTSSDLKPYKPSVRHCYFNEEKSLQFFQMYNQENCMLECLANFTIQECGCVSMHSPRLNSTSICGAAIKPCLEKAKSKFTNNQEDPKTRCDCLPSCNTLEYNVDISHSRWNWRPFMEVQRSLKSWSTGEDYIFANESHCSELILYYKDLQFITSERNELYTAADFLANCGGLLGLFTGATFISGVEVIYYLTVRLFFNLHMFGRRYWSGSEKLLKNKNRGD